MMSDQRHELYTREAIPALKNTPRLEHPAEIRTTVSGDCGIVWVMYNLARTSGVG